MEELARSARGGGITVLSQAGKFVIQFSSILLLSRLLSPEDIGLIAMVTAFVALGELIRDFGTSVVGLQREELDQQDASNLFWFSVVLGSGASLLMVAITPVVSGLYGESRINEIMPALAITVLLNAAAAQFQVRLARMMRFGRLAVADLASQLLGFTFAVAAALYGWDYWALVVQMVTISASGLALRWAFAHWLPSLPRKTTSNRRMFADSLSFGGAQLLTYIATNIDTIVIGARWDAALVGNYTRAFQLLTTPLNAIAGPLTQVVIPTINRARRSGRSPDSILLRMQFALGLPIIWLYAITAATADWLVPFLLGSDWRSASQIFQILAVGGAVWTFSRVSYWAFISANLGGELVRYNLVTKSLSSGLIFGASFLSIEAVAWAVSIGLIVSWPINLVWLAKTAGQRSWDFWWTGILLIAAGTLGFTGAWSYLLVAGSGAGIFAVAIAVGIGTTLYILFICLFRRGRSGLAFVVRTARAMLARTSTS